MRDRYVEMDYCTLAISNIEKKQARKYNYKRLLNMQNAWGKVGLPSVKDQPASSIVDNSMMDKAIKDMKTNNATCPTKITTEMLKISGGLEYNQITCR